MRPGFAFSEGEIVAVGARLALGFFRFDDLVRDRVRACELDRGFLSVERHADLAVRIGAADPAHERVGARRVGEHEFEPPLLGGRLARLHRVFRGPVNLRQHVCPLPRRGYTKSPEMKRAANWRTIHGWLN